MHETVELYPIIGKVKNATDVFKQIKKIHIDYEQENFIVICLNTKNQVIHSEILFKGGLNCCTIDVRTLFRVALKYNSCNIIVAHNHPSDHLQPSTEDEQIFSRIKNAGEILGIDCLDSVIFNNINKFYSMKQEEGN